MSKFVTLANLRAPLFVAWAVETTRRVAQATAALADTSQPLGSSGLGPEANADPEELSRLVTEHGEAIYRVALSVVRDAALAEDVAQDTLVKAWLALPNFRGDSSVKSWVLRIAHNTAISTLRLRRSVLTDPFSMPEQPQPAGTSVERRVENSAAMGDFVAELGKLDDLSRSVVVLREVEGLPYDEIAQILDIPLSTVKTRLMRARRRLGTALEEWAP
ncbi:MAG: RNA polymerase sigma factor [Acidimicrobiales bacterium]|nr:RNA polymerase sigma factor [Acidimicrobiales bacterium]